MKDSTLDIPNTDSEQQPREESPHKENDMTEAIAVRESDALMPVMSIETATTRYKTIVEYVKNLMHEGSDFGKIPGTDKATLLKPGAEKLCTLFGLSKRFDLVEHIEDWSGERMGEPFFNYLYRARLFRGEMLVAEADGSCNSRETKYRWRDAKQVCPQCNQSTIFKSKRPGEGFYCWAKKGGCAATFNEDDERITKQAVGRTPNPDIADQVNTIQKMAQKRALIAATLLAVNASEFFTQDLDDFIDITPNGDGKQEAPAEKTVKAAPRKPKTTKELLVQSVADAFKLLNNEGDEPKWTPKTADDFVARQFEGTADVDQLDEGQLNDLLKTLSERLDKLKGERSAIILAIRSHFDTEQHLTNYMKDHGGKKLEELHLAELKQIETDVTIPF